MSRWFRHYAGMMRDDKLVRAALKAKQPVERVIWVWGVILESAAEINDGGRFDIDPAEAAYFLRADEADILSIFAALEAGGRILVDCVVKWGDRQFQSDSSADRQKRYRNKQKTADNSDGERHSQKLHRKGDGEVTAASRHGDAPETETNTETESSEAKASGADAPPRDIRADLFGKGLKALAVMTGKTPDSCRSLVGKWLKAVNDEAIHVLGAIEDAERNRVADPVAWINQALAPKSGRGPPYRQQQPSFHEIAAEIRSNASGTVQSPSDQQGKTLEGELFPPPKRAFG